MKKAISFGGNIAGINPFSDTGFWKTAIYKIYKQSTLFKRFCEVWDFRFMGELFALRMKKKFWSKSTGFYIKVLIWGGIGIVITFIFRFYNEGVKAFQYAGFLISSDSNLTTVFLLP